MSIPLSPGVLTTDTITTAMDKKGTKGRGLTLAWILFLFIGVPFGFMAALAPITAAGIFIEPLRRFWQPWPPDLAKPFIGIAVFLATVIFLAFRSGRIKGFRAGIVAATAAFRNLVEGRRPRSEPEPAPAPTALVVISEPPAHPSDSPQDSQAPEQPPSP